MDLDLNDELGLDDLEPWDAPLGGVDGDFDEDYDLHGESPGDSDADVDLIADYERHAAEGDVVEVGPGVGDGGSCADTDREASFTAEVAINLDPLASTTNVIDTYATLNMTSPGNSSSPPKDPGEVGSENEADNIMCRELEKRLAVGSNVRDLDEAYVLYCEYGRVKGFGVRKGEQRYMGRSDVIKWKEFICCCAGAPDTRKSREQVPGCKKLLTRSGCRAKIRVSRAMGSPWRVSIFVIEHNHGLVSTEMTYMLRSSRNLSTANTLDLEALHASGIGISGAVGFMEKQCGGPQNLGFTRRDAYDHFARRRKKSLLESTDSSKVMQYFRDKANSEPFYYWNAQTDDEGRLVNLFFRDMRSAEDYRAFGDVVSLDTTYRTNMYNLICAPFVGISHHTFTILFGMGFLSDESIASFEWLFREFEKAMDGVAPKVIFTDQCMAMMKAIESVFPTSKHRLCQWHINRNAAKKFGSLNGNAAFKKLWYKCMNEVETEHDFDVVWKQIMCYTNPDNVPWFNNMYNLRRRWASVFTRGMFTAGLLATSRSEGTNRVVKSVQTHSMMLFYFVNNYEQMKSNWRRREKEEDTLGIWTPGQMVNDSPLFAQAATRYTRNVYKKFEAEAMRIFGLEVPHEQIDIGNDTIELKATNRNSGRSRTVTFNTKTFFSSCSCRKWEAEGILCRHIVKVYQYMNHFSIPESQILKRWTKTAKDDSVVQNIGTEIVSTVPYLLCLQTVIRHIYEMGCGCEGEDADRNFVLERLDKLRAEFFNVIGLRKPKEKRKVLHDLNCDNVTVDAPDFRDPKILKEKGFVSAREFRSLHTKRIRGTPERMSRNDPQSSSLPPRVPFEMIEHFRTSPNASPPHSAGWAVEDSQLRPRSQP